MQFAIKWRLIEISRAVSTAYDGRLLLTREEFEWIASFNTARRDDAWNNEAGC